MKKVVFLKEDSDATLLTLLLVTVRTAAMYIPPIIPSLQNTDFMRTCNARGSDPQKIITDGNRDIYGWLDSEHSNDGQKHLKIKNKAFKVLSTMHSRIGSSRIS
jgi:hypothetical protein